MFITTDDTLASDTFNSDGTLKTMASYLHIPLSDGIVFVEDDADLTGITHKKITSTPSLVTELNDKCRQMLTDTDWYVSRKTETDVAIPSHISTLRATLRTLIA